jgi:hypothetical protein
VVTTNAVAFLNFALPSTESGNGGDDVYAGFAQEDAIAWQEEQSERRLREEHRARVEADRVKRDAGMSVDGATQCGVMTASYVPKHRNERLVIVSVDFPMQKSFVHTRYI